MIETIGQLSYAQKLDQEDPLREYRQQFYIPQQASGEPHIYLCGNSLGLQPKTTAAAIEQELTDWRNLGVEGHAHAQNPWMPYHGFLTEAMAEVVGGQPQEVVVMNSLTVNLHLMMVSFYQPSANRRKIIIESDAFPSDRYAVESQIRFHGLDPAECLVELTPNPGSHTLREEDIRNAIETEGSALALVLIGNTNYYTGQYFDMKKISAWAHQQGAYVGFDVAHGAGNVPLNLHDSGCDFAVWCSYKYLNAGPGSLAGAFVHERHAHNTLPRFHGWWGHNKQTRFGMRDEFDRIPGVEAWQLSNPAILSMAAVWASLKIFQQAGIDRLRTKSIKLTAYLEDLVQSLGSEVVEIITPQDPMARGAQLSIKVHNADKQLFNLITASGVIADWREPDVIRVAPVPLYNSFEDVFKFYSILKEAINRYHP